MAPITNAPTGHARDDPQAPATPRGGAAATGAGAARQRPGGAPIVASGRGLGGASFTSAAVTWPAIVSSSRGAGSGRGLVAAQAEQDDGDVVLAAALVGGAHERLGGLVEATRGAQDRRQLSSETMPVRPSEQSR